MFRWRLICCLLTWGVLSCTEARAQAPAAPLVEDVWRDEDSAQPRWKFAGSDSRARLDRQRVVLGNNHDGQWCEEATLTSGNGTTIYLTRAIPAARIHPDLRLTVWVKSERVGVQFLARVVFPHQHDPQTGQPLTALIQGTSSSKTTWEQLQLDNIPVLVERQARVLLLQHGKEANLREPFLDLVLLNAYSGPGTFDLQWDDLRVEKLIETDSGVVPAQYMASAPAGTAAAWPTLPPVHLQGTVLNVNNQPFFPRIIEHQANRWQLSSSWASTPCAWPRHPRQNCETKLFARGFGSWHRPRSQQVQITTWRSQNRSKQRGTACCRGALDNILMTARCPVLPPRASVCVSTMPAASGRSCVDPKMSCEPTAADGYSEHRPVAAGDEFGTARLFAIARSTLALEPTRHAILGTRPTQPSSAVRAQWQTLTGRDWSVSAHEPDALRLQVNLAIGSGARGIEFAIVEPTGCNRSRNQAARALARALERRTHAH